MVNFQQIAYIVTTARNNPQNCLGDKMKLCTVL